VFDPPAEQASTIRHRNANAWDDECRRAHRSRVLRSSPLSLISTVGRPLRPIVLAPHSRRVVARANATQTAKIPKINKYLANQPYGALADRSIELDVTKQGAWGWTYDIPVDDIPVDDIPVDDIPVDDIRAQLEAWRLSNDE
jgi:hypothetical protein